MTAASQIPDTKPPLKDRLQALFLEYGQMALGIYFGIFLLVLFGFAAAIQFGFETEGTGGAIGTWGAAYLATKVLQPLRIGATLVLTPIVVRVLTRRKEQRATGRRKR